MISLDTNVLVRFLLDDDKAQSARAAKLVDRAIETGEALFVSDVALCETVWVLVAGARVRRKEVRFVLDGLLRSAHVRFEDAERLWRALDAFAAGKGDFADYVIREQARSAGCEAVVTFDRTLLDETGFTTP
jgi:predicted nucleic-acid-binding protein